MGFPPNSIPSIDENHNTNDTLNSASELHNAYPSERGKEPHSSPTGDHSSFPCSTDTHCHHKSSTDRG